VLAPLLVFTRAWLAPSASAAEYGGLAQRYVREFDQMAAGGAPIADRPQVGSADLNRWPTWATALKS
jgi:hypothetical protein